MARRHKQRTPEQQNEADLLSGLFRMMTVGPELGTAIHDYMLSNGISSTNQALRELISIALSQVPHLAVEHANRKLAFDRMRQRFIREAYAFVNQLKYQLDKEDATLAYLKISESNVEVGSAETVDGEYTVIDTDTPSEG